MTKQSNQNLSPKPEPQPGDVYEIPPEGSLGLLALGAVGLKAWREVRNAYFEEHADEIKANLEKQIAEREARKAAAQEEDNQE